MQGRLSPDPDNKIQFFPKETWEEEFHLAAQCGFEEIELTMDLNGWRNHPVMTEKGRDRLRSLAVSSGVKVSILCCDLFMKAPFFGTDRSKVDSHFKMLRQIISSCKDAGIELIEIPVIADARIKDGTDSASLSKGLFDCLDYADHHGVRLALETDLPPVQFRKLLDGLNGRVGANYDTGNSVFFGYDPVEEMAELKDFIAIDRIFIGMCLLERVMRILQHVSICFPRLDITGLLSCRPPGCRMTLQLRPDFLLLPVKS
jgi:hexulose-6-phosphate isomerase